MAKRRMRARPVDTDDTEDRLLQMQAELEELRATVLGNKAPDTVASWSKKGSLPVLVGKHRWYADQDYHIQTVRAAVGDAPTTTDLILDVNVNGESIFTDQGQRPRIKKGKFTLEERIDSEDIGEPTVEEDEYITVDIDTASGAKDLTVNVVMLEEDTEGEDDDEEEEPD